MTLKSITMDERTFETKPSSFSIIGQILDSLNNQPLAGVRIRLAGNPGQITETKDPETTTDANGYFVLKLDQLPDYRLKIEVNRADYDPLVLDLPPLNPRQGDQILPVIRLKQSLKSRLQEIKLRDKNINFKNLKNSNR